MLFVKSIISCSMGFRPSIFIAANKSYHIESIDENNNHSDRGRIDVIRHFLSIGCDFLMHLALGDIFPLNGKGQLGFIIALIVTWTNTNTNSIKLLVLYNKLKYVSIANVLFCTFGNIVASRSPVSKYLKTVVTFSISLMVSWSSPSTGTGVGRLGWAEALVVLLASDFMVSREGGRCYRVWYDKIVCTLNSESVSYLKLKLITMDI